MDLHVQNKGKGAHRCGRGARPTYHRDESRYEMRVALSIVGNNTGVPFWR